MKTLLMISLAAWLAASGHCTAQTVREEIYPPGSSAAQNSVCAEVAGIKECYSSNDSSYASPINFRGTASVALLSVIARTTALASAENNRRIDELKARNDDLKASVNASLAALTTELKQQNELMRTGLRAEILSRIERLPIDLAKDDQAYALIKERLKTDLREVFEPRKSP